MSATVRAWVWYGEVPVTLVPRSYRYVEGGYVVDVRPVDPKHRPSYWSTNADHVRDQDGRAVGRADVVVKP